MSPKARNKQSGPTPAVRKAARRKTNAKKAEKNQNLENRRVTRSQSKKLLQAAPEESRGVDQPDIQRETSRPRAQAPKRQEKSTRSLPSASKQIKKSVKTSARARGAVKNKSPPPEPVAEPDQQYLISSPISRTTEFSESGVLDDTSVQSSTLSSNARLPDQYYLSGGYSPPYGEDMASSARGASAVTNGSVKNKESRMSVTHKEFTTWLGDRNASYDTTEDPEMDSWKEILIPSFPLDLTTEEEEFWKTDLLKCGKSKEAIFQRTVMMELLDRHKLDNLLDYSCEEIWNSDTAQSLPYRRPEQWKEKLLKKPKPDLAVAFKSRSLLPGDGDTSQINALEHLRGFICPEGSQADQMRRAMHFFSIETKGKLGQIDNEEADFQNLNTAVCSLHNIYQVMRAAGEEERYFKKVRFFSVSASPHIFEVRIHRPVKAPKPINPSYLAAYRFDSLLKGHISGYRKTLMTKVIYNILFEYGVKILHPILKETLDKLLRSGSTIGASFSTAQSDTQASIDTGPIDSQEPLTQSFVSSTGSNRRGRPRAGAAQSANRSRGIGGKRTIDDAESSSQRRKKVQGRTLSTQGT